MKIENENLEYWRELFNRAQTDYTGVTQNLVKWWNQYIGKRDVETVGPDETYKRQSGAFPLVRNFTRCV